MSTRGAPARHRARSDGAPISAWTGRDEFELVDDDWLIAKRTITTEGVDPEGWAGSFSV